MKMKSVILFIALVILSAGRLDGSSAADEPLEDRHVIDWHAHAAGLGYGGSGVFINEQLRKNFRFRFYLKRMGVTQKELASGIGNPWDRDVVLKQALGVPLSVFSRVVGIPATKHSKMRLSSAAITRPGRSIHTPDSAPCRPVLSGLRP